MRTLTLRAVSSLLVFFLSLPLAAAIAPQDLLNAGRVDDAIETLNNRVSANPHDAQSLHLLCRAYFQYDDWDRAEGPCKRAAELEPNNSPYHRWLGRIYGEMAARASIFRAPSLAGKARDEFQRAAQLDPKDTIASVDVAEYYIEAPSFMGGGKDRARAQAKVVAKLSQAHEHWVYARIAEKDKDYATAEREYKQMIADGNSDGEAWLNLGFFYRNQKRYDDMEKAFVTMNQEPITTREVLFEAASTLYRTGRAFSFAQQLLRRYLAEGPVEEAPAFKAHNLLGLILEKQGDKAGAAAEYRAALALARNYRQAQEGLKRVAP